MQSANLRKLLLGSTAIVALGTLLSASPAMAAAVDLAGTSGAATAISDGDSITATVADKYGFIDTDSGVGILASSLANSGTLYISDSDTGGDDATFASLTIASGKTLSVIMGAGVDGTGVDDAGLVVTGATGAAGATLSIAGIANSTAGSGSTIDLQGAVTLSALNIAAGAGGTTAAGSTLTVTDVTLPTAITTVSMKGGAGGDAVTGAAGAAGGALTITDFGSGGSWTGTTLTVGGGAGGDGFVGDQAAARAGGAGGAIANNAVITGALNGAVNITGGAAGSAGDAGTTGAGGAAGAGGAVGTAGNGITVTGLVTGNVAITGGAASAGGEANTTAVGGAGGAGGAVYVKDMAGGVAGNVTVTSGAGSAAGASADGFAGGAGAAGGLVTVTDIDHITGNLTVTSGIGGAGGAAAAGTNGANAGAGGAITLTNPATGAAIGGNISVTAGNGGAAGVSSATAAAHGGTGGAGGAVTITNITQAVTGTTTLRGGAGAAGAVGGFNGDTAANGGAGGAVTATITGATTGNISLVGGAGANGGAGGVAGATGGAGGAGGAVALTLVGDVGGSITLNDGAAGTAGSSAVGTGGAAGAAGTTTVTLTGTTQVVSGAIHAAANNEGALVVSAGGGAITEFESAVGSSSAYLKSINSTNGIEVQFDSDVYATTISSSGGNSTYDFNGNVGVGSGKLTVGSGDATFAKNLTGAMTLAAGKDATFDGAVAQTVTGAIDGGGQLISSNTAGGVTFASAIGSGTAIGNITNGATAMTFGSTLSAANLATGTGTVTFGGATTLSGTLGNTDGGDWDLGANVVTVAGAVTATNPTIYTTIGDTYAHTGHIVSTNAGAGPTFTTSVTVTPTVSGTVIHTGDVVRLFDNTHAAGALPATVTATPTGLVTWTYSTAAAVAADRYDTGAATSIAIGDGILTATVKDASSVSGVTSESAPSVNALSSITTSADSDLQDLAGAVQSLSTGAEIDEAGAQLRPEINGAGQQAAFGAVNQLLNIVSARNDNIHMAQAGFTGLATGEGSRGYGIWGQGFGSVESQDRRENVDGYDASTYGVAFGADTRVVNNIRAGASFAYAHTNVDDKGARDGSGQDVNSYIGTIYGSYTANPWYVDASVTYGHHSYDSDRLVNFAGAPVQTASGDYDGEQFGIKGEVGYPIAMKNFIVTPFASMAYSHLSQDDYTETGAPGANLTVDSVDTYSARSGLGSRIAANFGSYEGWVFTPNASAAWMHEFNDQAPDMTSTFAAAGGTSFTTPGMKLATEAAQLGVGLDMASHDNVTVSLKYNAEVKDKYDSHTGLLQVRAEF